MFKNAAPMAAPAPKSKAKAKAEIEVKGIEELAMVSALQKALEAIAGTLEGMVKGTAWAHFCTVAADTGRRPDSFKGTEGDAHASLELRKRGSNHALSEESVTLLRSHGFEPGREVIQAQLYAINPKYAEDAELLGKVEAACAGIVPADFIMLQPERCKFIVTDELLEQVFQKKAAAEVIQTVTTLACKPALKEVNIKRILDFVTSLLTGPTPRPAANEPEKKAAA